MAEERLFAVRGAAQADANEPDAILVATEELMRALLERNDSDSILAASEELMRELMDRNDLGPHAMVSCVFTATDDLDAEFPAVAARKVGLDSVPLLCAREINVPGAMQRVIRVMVHYYAPLGHTPAHAYLGEAQELRSDLKAAQ